MQRVSLSILVALAFAGAFGGTARAGGPTMQLGVAEDSVRSANLVTARGRMAQLRLAGFTAVRVTTNWVPGATAPSATELAILRNVDAAARLTGVRLYLSVYQVGSRTTPLTPEARSQFAAYSAALVTAIPTLANVIVGNEPNLNRFWLPQFNVDGSIASAAAYEQLLAQTYDAIKAADPTVTVWGGATSPRGSDRPDGIRPTTSPTAFIRGLGAAYRASGRTTPIMDGYTHHPYLDTSSQDPAFTHPLNTTIAIADYGKLVSLLGEAFAGTAQAGSTLPILYDEFGIEATIPAGKASLYTGTEPTTTKPVDERTQAASYDKGLQLAFCQPNVVGMLLFHSHDEPELPAWQSGVYYVDGTPKASLTPVRDSLARTRGGSIARCEGLALDTRLQLVKFPTAASFARGVRDVRFRCTLDCAWEVTAVRVPAGSAAARVKGYARAGVTTIASLAKRRLARGTYQLTLSASQPVNPGAVTTRTSAKLVVP